VGHKFEVELVAFAARGTNWGLLTVTAGSVCWLHGLSPCFKTCENATRTKVSERWVTKKWWQRKLRCKVAKTNFRLLLCLLLFGKKIPPQSFPIRVCAGTSKA